LREVNYCLFTGIGNATGCQPSTIQLQVKVIASTNIKALDFIACFEEKCVKKRVPKLAKIKMRDTSPATKVTIKNAKLCI